MLTDFNLDIGEGQVVCLFGPNGCGKTTLLRLCAGLARPTGGELEIRGQIPEKSAVGYIPQKFSESLFPWLSCLDNIAFPLYMNGMSRTKARAKAKEAAARVSRTLALDRNPYELSIGQQQMVALARALVRSPAVLLADEPFSALDFQARIEMQDVFQNVLRPDEKVGALFISHNVEDAVYMGDKVIVTSPLPMAVLKTFDVPASRPRTQDFKKSEEFFRLVTGITDEFLKGRGA